MSTVVLLLSLLKRNHVTVKTTQEYAQYAESGSQSPERTARIDPVWELVSLQDYRRRYALYVGEDEGLRNLRRRAPMVGTWDDHEIANDSWVNGAENHQPICPANASSTIPEILEAQCSQDEGDAAIRWTQAVQAYLEWQPIRHAPGIMGNVEIALITQVIEWGNLASLVTVDSRISYRSEDPTINSLSRKYHPM